MITKKIGPTLITFECSKIIIKILLHVLEKLYLLVWLKKLYKFTHK